jgi:hypothetical protein
MPDEITTYVSRYAPELDPEDVRKFMAAHAPRDNQRGTHVQWATRMLREAQTGARANQRGRQGCRG